MNARTSQGAIAWAISLVTFPWLALALYAIFGRNKFNGYLASFSYYQNTLPLGVSIYRYTAGFMHQKVFLIDSWCAAVGTANLDNRSFRLNFEITLLNYDSSFISEVETMLSNDFARSQPASMEEYSRRPFLFKLAVRSARLLAPIL